jgi:hypothetical protein
MRDCVQVRPGEHLMKSQNRRSQWLRIMSAIVGLIAIAMWSLPILANSDVDQPNVSSTDRKSDDDKECRKDSGHEDEDWRGKRLHAISGVVTDGSSSQAEGIGGVTITVTNGNRTTRLGGTDRAGKFRIDDLPPGQYTVSPTQQGYVFNPVNIAVTIKSCSIKGLTFTRNQPAEGLSPVDAERIDAEPDTATSPETTILPNGQTLAEFAASQGIPIPPGLGGVANGATSNALPSGIKSLAEPAVSAAATATDPQQQKNIAITQMLLSAQNYACGRQPTPCLIWNYQADPTDPVNMPAQTGLTYVYGRKTPSVRTQPLDGCPQLTYGMDCSGLIYNIAQAAGLTVPTGTAATQANPANWSVPPSWRLQIQLVTDGSTQTGDILAWPGHIGIANSPSVVISSTGVTGQCTKNINPPRGPRTLTISQLGLGPPTAVLRLVQPGATTTTLAANPSSLPSTGGTVTLTATVAALQPPPAGTPAPTGTVTFIDQNGVTFCSAVALASGSAMCSTSISTPPDTVKANYSGDTNYAASTGSVTVAAGTNPWVGAWDGTITSTCGFISGPFDIVITSAGGNQLGLTDQYGDAYTLTISSSDPNAASSTLNGGIFYTISGNSMTVSEPSACQTGSLKRQ